MASGNFMPADQTTSAVHRLRRGSTADRFDKFVIFAVDKKHGAVTGSREIKKRCVATREVTGQGRNGRRLHDCGRIDEVRECDGAALREASDDEVVGGASGLIEKRDAEIVNSGDCFGQRDGVRPVVVNVVPKRATITLVLWLNHRYEPLFARVEQSGPFEKRFGSIAVPGEKHEYSIGALGPPTGTS
jgi:hypothetical protein